MDQNDSVAIQREIAIHKKLKHPQIVRMYNSFVEGGCIYIVLEFMEHGNIFRLLRETKVPEELVVNIMSSVLAAVFFFHEMEIVHRDIKPENVLWNKKLEFKLSDFGFSAGYTEKTGRKTMCGTAEYMAPEVIESQPQNDRVDIWCLGILLFELVHQTTPFESRNMYTLLNEIKTKKVVVASTARKDFREFIEACLVADPRRRPSAKALLERFPVFDLRRLSRPQPPLPTAHKAEVRQGRPKPNPENANFKKKPPTANFDTPVSESLSGAQRPPPVQSRNAPAQTVVPKPVEGSGVVPGERAFPGPLIKHASSLATLGRSHEAQSGPPVNGKAFHSTNGVPSTDGRQPVPAQLETKKLKLHNSPKELDSITQQFKPTQLSAKSQTAPYFYKQTANADNRVGLQSARFTVLESPMKGLPSHRQQPLPLGEHEFRVRTNSAQNDSAKGHFRTNQNNDSDAREGLGPSWTASKNEYFVGDGRGNDGGQLPAKATDYRLNANGLVNIYHKPDGPFGDHRLTPLGQPGRRETDSALTKGARDTPPLTVLPTPNGKRVVATPDGPWTPRPPPKALVGPEAEGPRPVPLRQTCSSVEHKRFSLKDPPGLLAKFCEYDFHSSSKPDPTKATYRRMAPSGPQREERRESDGGREAVGCRLASQASMENLALGLGRTPQSTHSSGSKGDQLKYKLQSRGFRDVGLRGDSSGAYKALAQTHF